MNSTDWTKPSPNSTDYTKPSINSTNYAATTPNSTQWGIADDNGAAGYLLLQTGFKLILQDGLGSLLLQ